VTRRSTRLTALAATLLAVAVAAGVSTPRLRTGGRERAARGAALAGSTRPDQPCAWVEPDDDFAAAVTADPGHVVAGTHAAARPSGADVFVLPPSVAAAVDAVSSTADLLPLQLTPDLTPRRSSSTRGPPARLS
jgi:hypothetical protein